MTHRRIIAIASFVYIIDRISKILIYGNFTPGGPLEIVPNIFRLTLVLNDGAAFGLFHNQNAFFIALSLIAVAAIIFYVWKVREARHARFSVALGFILGGALGNLTDRLFFGCVIDFLDFRIWPVFNVADSAITVGAAILALSIITNKRKT